MRLTGLAVRALGCLFLASHGAAMPSPLVSERVGLSPDLELEKRGPTCNTPTNRACYRTGYSINTDYEDSFPPGGVTRNVSILFHYAG